MVVNRSTSTPINLNLNVPLPPVNVNDNGSDAASIASSKSDPGPRSGGSRFLSNKNFGGNFKKFFKKGSAAFRNLANEASRSLQFSSSKVDIDNPDGTTGTPDTTGTPGPNTPGPHSSTLDLLVANKEKQDRERDLALQAHQQMNHIFNDGAKALINDINTIVGQYEQPQHFEIR